MTLEQYLKQYSDGYNHDNAYGEQCVDWFRGYCKLVLEISQPAGVKGAYQFWDNRNTDTSLKANFTAIENTATAIPQYGDVIIWKKALNGEFGHVAICIDKAATTSKFISSDQNWDGKSTQANQLATKPEKITHTYSYVAGFLRPKDQSKINGQTTTESTTMTDDQKARENGKHFLTRIAANINASPKDDFANMDTNGVDNIANEVNTAYKDKNSLATDISAKNLQISELQSDLTTEKSTVTEIQKTLGTQETLITKQVAQISTLTSQLEKKTADVEALQKSSLEDKQVLVATAKDTLDKQAKDYEKKITALELTVNQLKTNINTIEVEKDYSLKELLIKVWEKIWERI